MTTSTIECYFCGCTVPSIEIAIERGWMPSFWEPGDTFETCEPVCSGCCERHLEVSEDGELVRVTD